MDLFNIGVYNSSETEFFRKIIENKIDTFIDVRQRRGVRGAKYSFVNSKRLQDRLSQLNIKYYHILALAPNEVVRNLQKIADRENNERKRNRDRLDSNFITNYEKLILDNFDLKTLLNELKLNKSEKVVFFCVEEKADACHRALITKRLRAEFDLLATNL